MNHLIDTGDRCLRFRGKRSATILGCNSARLTPPSRGRIGFVNQPAAASVAKQA